MIRIEHEDAFNMLTSIKPNSVDLILTDPPYTISRSTGFQDVVNGVQRFAVSMDFGEWDKDIIDLDKLARLSYQSLKKHGAIIVFYDLWKITNLAEALNRAGFVQLRLIVWEKTNPVPLNSKRNYLTNSREIAVLGVKHSKPTFHSDYDNGVYRHAIPNGKDGGRFHPTQKPIDLMQQLIEKHSNPGELVVDPFLGGGSTAIAAWRCGRNFMGCDISEKYIRVAQERIVREIQQTCNQETISLEKIQCQADFLNLPSQIEMVFLGP